MRILECPSDMFLIVSASWLLTLSIKLVGNSISIMVWYEQSVTSFSSMQSLWSKVAMYFHHNSLSMSLLIYYHRKYSLICSWIRSTPLVYGCYELSGFLTFLQYNSFLGPTQSSLLQIQVSHFSSSLNLYSQKSTQSSYSSYPKEHHNSRSCGTHEQEYKSLSE